MTVALGLAVGLVLADSSVVILALPEIYRSLDVSVGAVVWVLVAFNLVLALCAVPAAGAARRFGPARATTAGLGIFAAASLLCGLAPAIGVLIAARCVQAGGGAILIAGGLVGLALLPKASVAATVPPQLLAGAGLALSLSALTEAALEGRSPQAIHGGWTIAARHAGVVLSLLLLTPVFTADLREQRSAAEQAGTAALLDAAIAPLLKIEIAGRIADTLDDERGRVPVIDPAFEPPPGGSEDRPAVLRLRDELQDQLDRAATHAFSASFLISAAFAAAALLPIAAFRRRPREVAL
jgi:MFS family permease